ncbi:hypothetical protein CEXT_747151, partial [Caerostris extrusa]
RINATGPEDVPEIFLPVDNAEEIAKRKIPPLFFSEDDFCAFYCSLGILVPCDRSVGIVTYNDLYYGFSNKDAMDSFIDNPSKYVALAMKYLIGMPQLICTFQLEESFHFPIIVSAVQ